VNIDDLKNPEYRKGRRNPVQPSKTKWIERPIRTEEERRIEFAAQLARSEFGRFYWSERLGRRMQRELEKSRQLKREAAAQARRKRNGAKR
jgi:hypothetical protein